MRFLPKVCKGVLRFVIVAISILLSGCAAYYPQVVDVPLIKGKGDVRTDIGAFLIPDPDYTLRNQKEPIAVVGLHSTVTAGLTDNLAEFKYHRQRMDFAFLFVEKHFHPFGGLTGIYGICIFAANYGRTLVRTAPEGA
jgi:hypothetical protein